MKALVILQARTASTRLPRKALLPIAGYPSAILAALRAANRQHATILATSDDSSDDVLASEARNYGIEVFRGPLGDVLSRYYLATANLPSDCVVVRLTGDNVIPDGALVAEVLQVFARGGAEYLDVSTSFVPYGLSVEAFSVATLRTAHALARSPEEREHVGLWMKRNCKSVLFTPRLARNENFSHLRCTIDEPADYELMLRLFQDVSNPVKVPWLGLVRKLAGLTTMEESDSSPSCERVEGKFVLGTAQLGMEYGRVNETGKPTRKQAIAIARGAIAHGITQFDTARAYGDAESVLGEALVKARISRGRVITKLNLEGVAETASQLEVGQRVDASIDASLCALRTHKLDTLLLHNWAHYEMWGGAAWRRLLELQKEDRVSILGASVYGPGDAIAALAEPAIRHLQIPMNLLDWRWKTVAQALAERPDVIVHARSSLLQGILIHSADRWPKIPDFDLENCVRKLRNLAEKFERRNIADLCFAYVRSLPWITSVVVGCETLGQLEQNIELFAQPKLTTEQLDELEHAIPKPPETLLNPAKWSALEPIAAYAS